ncbi:signal transduction histidine kinase [Streptosporangium lutulentum]|uniref:histidine kinase n=1 Tax=Streptosporangium lutulentum TaxID=1461250 RepID=A0ABT9Q5E9_9ACTN|nr:histidine kinase [Streptosporangium lutulentum]MDP9841964.1 signal transduction histidine kinase [Streptosporangium lutulentum]
MDAVAAFVVVGVFWLPSIIEVAGTWRLVAGPALAAVAAAAMLLHRRLPVPAVTAAGAATVVASLLGLCQDPMLATAWCLYSLALTHASRVRVFVLVAVGVVAVLAAVTGVPEESLGGWGQRVVIAVTALSVSWLLGVTVGRQVESVRETERAWAVEQALRVQLDVARDVHDVVGHALGLISAEAGVTRGLADASEQELRDALAGIEEHARSALEDIQSLVRSLRAGPGVEPGRASATAPVPGISQLPSLVAATRAAGVRADARIAAPGQVDEIVAAIAFRIVQEALSNVVRHAPGAACTVELHPDGDVLVVRVRDDGPGKEDGVSGFGLRGMRERARLVGGWRNLPDRGFEVEARLPSGVAR